MSTGRLFRCLKQFGHVKEKNIQWKIHRNKSTSLFQVTVGYNQWCPRLHHKKHTVQAIPSMHTVQAIPSMHTKKKKKGKGDKGERHNEKKTRRRRRREKDGERGERKKKKQMRKQWRRIGEEKEKKRGEV